MLLEGVGKLYTLKNGYKIRKSKLYNGYEMKCQWSIWSPDGSLYMNCISYEEAYELASNLRGKEL